jgi:hypothetical protein
MVEKKLNFIVVGTAKSGTTSLFNVLKNHPDIFIPEKKEMNFFNYGTDSKIGPNKKYLDDYPEQIYDINQYHNHYKDSAKINGDISPVYLYNHETTIKNIKKYCKDDIKIIIILRNPIDRAFSQYMHAIREGWENKDFYNALISEEDRKKRGISYNFYYARFGKYYLQVKSFIEEFKNVKIYFYEELFDDKFYKDLFTFLEVKKIKIQKTPRLNATGVPKLFILKKSLDFLKSIKILKIVANYLGLKQFYIKIKFWNLKKNIMDDKSRNYLKNYFKKDIKSLEKLLNKNLSSWV